MKRTLFLSAISVLFLFSLPACDSSDGDNGEIPSQNATFEATMSGAVEGEITGTAFSSGTGVGWGLVLVTDAGKSGIEGSITFIRSLGGRPGEGTYSVVEADEEETTDFYAVGVINSTAFPATSGNVVITSSSSNNVRGTFGFSATSGSQTLTIEGGFNAQNSSFAE
jgi:hypothetical protein